MVWESGKGTQNLKGSSTETADRSWKRHRLPDGDEDCTSRNRERSSELGLPGCTDSFPAHSGILCYLYSASFCNLQKIAI